MTLSPPHPQDDQLLLFASGELRGVVRGQISAHLESCEECKSRLIDLEKLESQLRATHRDTFVGLPSAAGPRALLKANLTSVREHSVAEHSKGLQPSGLNPFAGARGLAGRAAAAGIVAASIVVAILVSTRAGHRDPASALIDVAQLSAEPNTNLTPGAAISLTRNQVCAEAPETTGDIPQALKVQVLRSYGVAVGSSDTYEVDYLITPGLGGATDVRNLWPEPYDHTVWNAHVKDQLEDRLRSLVCQGSLDLITAQHDISTDWIAAYHKYFHSDTPLAGPSPVLPDSHSRLRRSRRS